MTRVHPVVAVMVLASCRAAPTPPPSPAEQLAATLSALVDSTLAATPGLPGMMLRVEAPRLGLTWTKAVGISARGSTDSLRPDQTLRIASNTKTYVAAAILRLIEDGRLGWDAPIAPLLLPASVARMKAGGYLVDRMTVRMLLQHTSGLFDYATVPAGGTKLALYGPFFDRILADPGHRWTRPEQLALAMEHGTPYGKPGEVYHYSDTGYILLGEILETVTGQPMAAAVRELLDFAGHGLSRTYFETLEPVPANAPARVHQYMDSLDTNTFDASVDLYGGGGLVSNLEDLARFYRDLVQGKVFKRPATLDSMLAVQPLSRGEGSGGYGMGIGMGEVDGLRCYGHGGFWGTVVRHCPAADLTVVGAVTNTAARPALASLVQTILGLVGGAVAKAP